MKYIVKVLFLLMIISLLFSAFPARAEVAIKPLYYLPIIYVEYTTTFKEEDNTPVNFTYHMGNVGDIWNRLNIRFNESK